MASGRKGGLGPVPCAQQSYRTNMNDLRKYLILWARWCLCAKKKSLKKELIFQGQALETVKGRAKVRKKDYLCDRVFLFCFFLLQTQCSVCALLCMCA